MQKVSDVIPPRGAAENALKYAYRLKRAGYKPSEVMEKGLYDLAVEQKRTHAKILKEELKQRHACMVCEGLGVVRNAEDTEWLKCLTCEGSGMETAGREDLAPKELEFMAAIIENGRVFIRKILPEFVKRVYWYCDYKGITDMAKMIDVFDRRTHCVAQTNHFMISCECAPAWKYQQTKEEEKQSKKRETIEDDIPWK